MPCVVSERFDGIGADGAPVRLGIMGGTFDPIHMGHLAVAEEMRAKLDLDAVLFVPAGSPVFKKGQDVTDPRMRVEMCRLAVAGNPHFDVSTIEVDREGDTFTVDTLRELREHFPPNVDLYFIVGSDSAITIGKWRNVAEIAELAHLAVAAGRPGSASKEELEAAIAAAAPFDAHVVNVSSLEISSTALRERLRAGDPCRYVMPESVRTFIRERKLYQSGEGRRTAGDALAGEPEDALSKEFFKARKKELEKRVSEKRFKHILGVSETCGRLAEEYGVDVRKARLAGLLHDWDKGMNDDEARQRVVELGMIDRIDPYIVENMPTVLHGITAACALGREHPSIPSDVLQAVERHTTAAEGMSPLDMVLYVADAIEPNRKFGRIDELRSYVGAVDLEELYFKTYEYWVFLLFERRKPLHPDTIRIWNAFTARRAKRKGK